MAIRKIREFGDNVLRKQCKEVKEVTGRVRTLVEDMIDTMYEANGVGLAAPQVGVMKRIVVIDVGDGPIVFINPKILESDGEQFGTEGCLSLPGKMAYVRRPNHVKACAYDIDMNYFEIEGEELLARAICHELDHLDGVLYIDRMEGELLDNTYVPEEE
ncbi:MAG: peptide deformylase [Lachnospiraceae bacterium]|nr:peptide deformylase [Lachnospiraceae bacterium]